MLELCLERDELCGADGVGQAGDVAEHLVRVGAEVEVRAVGARHAPALPLLRLGLQGRHRRHLAPPAHSRSSVICPCPCPCQICQRTTRIFTVPRESPTMAFTINMCEL